MTFTGRAIYETGLGSSVFKGVAEDVADIIGMISPYETPLLDRIGDAPYPAANVFHEWLEDSLCPNTIVSSSTLVNSTGLTTLGVCDTQGNAVTGFLQVGAVLKENVTGEFMQITALNGNSITVTRAFAGTTVGTIAAGDTFFVISDAALEGADVTGDISRPRLRQNNYCQIFKKDIIISGTVQNVTQLGGVTDELDYQKTMRLRESLRDLEKALINGKLSGNTLGSATAYRTFQGVWDRITTNATSVATLSPKTLDDTIQLAWNYGATDINLIIADSYTKRIIDGWNVSRVLVGNDTEAYHRRVTLFEGTFGTFEVMLNRWMPANSFMVLATDRIKVLPLRGRSFQYIPIAPTGDAMKGMVLGEYTIQMLNQEGMSKCYVP